MRSVSIIGIGQTPVGELWNLSARQLAYQAVAAAMAEAGVDHADALFLGNMLSGSLLDQEHMATLVADFCGLHGIEAAKVEAACASGAAALRVGTMAVASNPHFPALRSGHRLFHRPSPQSKFLAVLGSLFRRLQPKPLECLFTADMACRSLRSSRANDPRPNGVRS